MKSLLGNTRKPDLVFYYNGTIDISMRVSRLLGLRPADVIDVLTDNGEYYLYIRRRAPHNGVHECTVAPTSPNSEHYRTYSCRLARAMLDICGVTEVARLTVADPIDIPPFGIALPIITKMIIQ